MVNISHENKQTTPITVKKAINLATCYISFNNKKLMKCFLSASQFQCLLNLITSPQINKMSSNDPINVEKWSGTRFL